MFSIFASSTHFDRRRSKFTLDILTSHTAAFPSVSNISIADLLTYRGPIDCSVFRGTATTPPRTPPGGPACVLGRAQAFQRCGIKRDAISSVKHGVLPSCTAFQIAQNYSITSAATSCLGAPSRTIQQSATLIRILAQRRSG